MEIILFVQACGGPREHLMSISFVCLVRMNGLLLTYGLATRHACYAPATRPLLAVDLHVWFSQDEEVITQQVK